MKKLIILITILVYSCDFDTSIYKDTMKFMAYGYAEKAVKKQLRSPSTALFPDYSEKSGDIKNVFFKDEDNSEWIVNSWVDSQNGFGAITRSNFSIKIIIRRGVVRYESLNIE